MVYCPSSFDYRSFFDFAAVSLIIVLSNANGESVETKAFPFLRLRTVSR